MPVGCQRFLEVFVIHDHKGDAIGQRPIFIRTTGHSLKAAVEQVCANWDDSHTRTGPHCGDQRKEVRVIRRAGAGVAQLKQDELGSNNGEFEPEVFHSLRVSWVIGPQQSQEKESVRESGAHDFLGSPLM
jgi:hypothetical protein